MRDTLELLTCPQCRQGEWAGSDELVRCLRCHAAYPVAGGVLDLTGVSDEASITREQDAAYRTERDPALGGINDQFSDLAAADGPLQSAILTLPHGEGSRYYREPGYFSNVNTSVAAFDFLLQHLDARPGARVLDLGADLTWSTSHLARRGLRCIAVDINHHLAAARLFFERYRVSYDLVRADMSRVSFRDHAFDIVVAINALHHGSDLGVVAANIGRMLRPGGRLAFIEPYCLRAEDRLQFGAAQIAAGINEHTYFLQEWHSAFTKAGLSVRVHRVGDSFAAVYEKSGQDPAGESDLFAGFYAGDLAAGSPQSPHGADGALRVEVRLRNRGNGTWCEWSGFPVRASYHLYRMAEDAKTLVSFDNSRTALPAEIGPGAEVTAPVDIARPAAPGRYVAEIDLVHEGVRWFSERGLHTLPIRFTIAP